MRKALIVGIDYYRTIQSLAGAVNDAHAVKAMLERHADGSVNFGIRLISGTGSNDVVDRSFLKEAIRELFNGDGEVALLYFAGHGYLETTGGYLCAGDCRTGDDGVPLAEVLTLANLSKAQNKVILLDSCHGGIAASRSDNPALAEVNEGVTILTASTADQYATEENGTGVFTNLLIDALGGAAGNLVGEVTPGAIYAHIDQSLGPWAQRPVFKTNVKRFVSLRKVRPPLELAELQRISEFFRRRVSSINSIRPTNQNAAMIMMLPQAMYLRQTPARTRYLLFYRNTIALVSLFPRALRICGTQLCRVRAFGSLPLASTIVG